MAGIAGQHGLQGFQGAVRGTQFLAPNARHGNAASQFLVGMARARLDLCPTFQHLDQLVPALKRSQDPLRLGKGLAILSIGIQHLVQVHQCTVSVIEPLGRVARQSGQDRNAAQSADGRQLPQQRLLERRVVAAPFLDVGQGRQSDAVFGLKVERLAERRCGAIEIGQRPGLERANAQVERRALDVVVNHVRLVSQGFDQSLKLARPLVEPRQLVERLQIGLVSLSSRPPGGDGHGEIATGFVQTGGLAKQRQPERRFQLQRTPPLQHGSHFPPITPTTIERFHGLQRRDVLRIDFQHARINPLGRGLVVGTPGPQVLAGRPHPHLGQRRSIQRIQHGLQPRSGLHRRTRTLRHPFELIGCVEGVGILVQRTAQGIQRTRQVAQTHFRQVGNSSPESSPLDGILAAQEPRLRQYRHFDEITARLGQWFQDVEHGRQRLRASRQRTQGCQGRDLRGHALQRGPKGINGTVDIGQVMQAQLTQGGQKIGLTRPVHRHLGLAGQHLFQFGVALQPAQQNLQMPQRLRLTAGHARHLPPELDRACRIAQ